MADGKCISCGFPTKQFLSSGKFKKWCGDYKRSTPAANRCIRSKKKRLGQGNSGVCARCRAPTKVFKNGNHAKWCDSCIVSGKLNVRKTEDKPAPPCVECGKQTRPFLTWHKIKFCSSKCREKNKWKTGRGKSGKPGHRIASGTCAFCEKAFSKKVNYWLRPERGYNQDKYCDRHCSSSGRHGQTLKGNQIRDVALAYARSTRAAYSLSACKVCQRLHAHDSDYCSELCRYHSSRTPADPRPCKCCHVIFQPRSKVGMYCSMRCMKRVMRRNRRKTPEGRARKLMEKTRRRMRMGVREELVDPYKVFTRDGWTCQICGVDTPRSLRGSYEPNAPELDHIVSLAKRGTHTYENTQCACRRCNGSKGSGVVPLMLCGG